MSDCTVTACALLTVRQVAERLALAPATVRNGLSARRRGLAAPGWALLNWLATPRPRLPAEELTRYLAELQAQAAPAAGSPAEELLAIARGVARLYPGEACRLEALARRIQLRVVEP